MNGFEKLNIINGFDIEDLKNAKQNNYAWSIAELDDYIYVGTGRNIAWMASKLLGANAVAPLLIRTTEMDDTAEIWRYKKDDKLDWQRVYKAKKEDNVSGFRFMISHKSKNSTKALYAASFSSNAKNVSILKSTDGSNWTDIALKNKLIGSSSRAMASFNGKLYVSCIEDALGGSRPLLYESEDPEFFDFKLVTNSDDSKFIKGKNPSGGIADMAVFNNKLYVTVGNEKEGLEVWRTNSSEVKMNDWTLVVDKGFGDALNANSISIGVFEDHLYVASVKRLPLALVIPMGSEIVRINKNDKWELVVGGTPIIATNPETGKRKKSLSGYRAGFSNPFNVYIWQMKAYNGMFLASTFDHGSNIEVLRDIALLNKDIIVKEVGEVIYNIIIKIYDNILALFKKINYQRGFDLYASYDGIHFKPVFLNGLGNGNNYGGRILMVDSDDNLIIGTANPYDGCEVYINTDNGEFMYDIDKCEYSDPSIFREMELQISKYREELFTELKKKNINLSEKF